MKQLLVSIAIVFASVLTVTGQNHSFSLSGKWNFQIDREDAGMKEQWFNKSLDESINLPGSMPEKLKGDNVTARTQWTGSLYDSSYYFNPYMEKYRIEGKVKLPFFLTPDKHYVGVAWYQKKVTIPSDWKGERILLFLERPHIETTVWVNTKEIGMQNSLCVPHVYDLTSAVTPGKPCRITIRVDNRIKEINVGPDSHSITDQTQGNWNGIVGKIELQTTPKVYFDDIQVYPDLSHGKALVRMNVKSSSSAKGEITLSAESFNTDTRHNVLPVQQTFRIQAGDNRVEMELPMGKDFLTWDEFNPALYKLTATLNSGKQSEKKQISEGDELLVQVTRDAVKTKDAVVSTKLVLHGHYCFLSSENTTLGVSKKIPQERAQEMIALANVYCKDHEAEGYGLVFRTNAQNVSEEELKDRMI